MKNNDIYNSLFPMIPFNHMTFASVSYSGGQLKVYIEYEKGNRYTFKR